jgi:hypothetical protein
MLTGAGRDVVGNKFIEPSTLCDFAIKIGYDWNGIL